jgi:hypothetical protein
MRSEGDVFDLTAPEEFLRVKEAKAVDALIATNGNQSEAYRSSGYTGGRCDAARFFRRPKIRRAVAARLARLIASGDEALRRISTMARLDIRLAFPNDKWLAGLPDEVALAIKSITPTKHGQRVEFYDCLRANQLLAQADGKLKETVHLEASLEEILGRANELEPGKIVKQLRPGTDE